jgi:hypothetical protein
MMAVTDAANETTANPETIFSLNVDSGKSFSGRSSSPIKRVCSPTASISVIVSVVVVVAMVVVSVIVDLRIFFLLLVERVRKEEETNKRI